MLQLNNNLDDREMHSVDKFDMYGQLLRVVAPESCIIRQVVYIPEKN